MAFHRFGFVVRTVIALRHIPRGHNNHGKIFGTTCTVKQNVVTKGCLRAAFQQGNAAASVFWDHKRMDRNQWNSLNSCNVLADFIGGCFSERGDCWWEFCSVGFSGLRNARRRFLCNVLKTKPQCGCAVVPHRPNLGKRTRISALQCFEYLDCPKADGAVQIHIVPRFCSSLHVQSLEHMQRSVQTRVCFYSIYAHSQGFRRGCIRSSRVDKLRVSNPDAMPHITRQNHRAPCVIKISNRNTSKTITYFQNPTLSEMYMP